METKFMWKSILALTLSACLTESPVENATLIAARMKYDPNAIAGFVPSPTYQIKGDTAIFRDYFALIHQPDYSFKANFSGDTLSFEYLENGDALLDWMPTVEAEIRMHLEVEKDSIWVRFPKVAAARVPSKTEAGFRDAHTPYLIRVGLK